MANCSSCGDSFICGLRETSEPCWCAELPKLAAVDPALDCLCARCLAERLALPVASVAQPADADAR
jgi:hypothetical protein